MAGKTEEDPSSPRPPPSAPSVDVSTEEENNEDLLSNNDEGADGEVDEEQSLLEFETCGVERIVVDSLSELTLRPDAVEAIHETWEALVKAVHGREQAGMALYSTVVEALPSLSKLFKTPKMVMGMRYMHGFRQLVEKVGNPPDLKVFVESLAFQHLEFEVNVTNLGQFRTAVMDLFTAELGDDGFPSLAYQAWCILLNYTGGAFIYVRQEFSQHIKIVTESWALINHHSHKVEINGSSQDNSLKKTAKNGDPVGKQKTLKDPAAPAAAKLATAAFGEQQVPTTFEEMFAFNATVMGFGSSLWMREVLRSLSDVVGHVSDCCRLQEECETLALKLRTAEGIDFGEFKAVMLASLRSLLPKSWDSQHEQAWAWLWTSIETIFKASMTKVGLFASHLKDFNARMTEEDRLTFQDGIYTKFFDQCPSGQEYFKQSSSRLRGIAKRIIALVEEFYFDPYNVIEELSALGLKHVGYGVPMDLFPPFVDASVQQMKEMVSPEKLGRVGRGTAATLCPVDRSHYLPENEMSSHVAMEAFRWCIGLVARTLVRTTQEGSSLIMTAIGANSAKRLKKAAQTLPRGDRARSMLEVQVGSHSISPLQLAIEKGSLEAARAILTDLLTFRADRDHYYYGLHDLFQRHPDIVGKLCQTAPALVPALLDGLVWRSADTADGLRRVNYYIKYLVVGVNEEVSPAIKSLIRHGDPNLIVHEAVTEPLNILWSQVGVGVFLQRKAWMFITVVVYLFGQSFLERSGIGNEPHVWGEEQHLDDILLISCRLFVYVLTLGSIMYRHGCAWCKAFKTKDLVKVGGPIWIPSYLHGDAIETANFILIPVLLSMASMDYVIYCFAFHICHYNHGFDHDVYHVLSAAGVLLHCMQLWDLGVLSLKIAAFKLVCVKVITEVLLWLVCLVFLVLSFSSAVLALDQDHPEFNSWGTAGRSLILLAMGMHEMSTLDMLSEHLPLSLFVLIFIALAWIFLVNMLVAQFTCNYLSVFQHLDGYAILERGHVLLAVLPYVSSKRWKGFVGSTRFDQALEFGAGDVGLPGGVQRYEPAWKNPIAKEQIQRFGGSSSRLLPFPMIETDEDTQAQQMERMIRKTVQKAVRTAVGGDGARMSGSGTKRSQDTPSSSHSSHA